MMSKMTATFSYVSNEQHYPLNVNGSDWSSICGAFKPLTNNSDGIVDKRIN